MNRNRVTRIAALLLVVALTAVTGIAVAADTPRDSPAEGEPSAIVHQGERLDSQVSRSSLGVEEPTIEVFTYPTTVSAGSQLTLTGQGPEGETVRAYVRIDDHWVPLSRDASRTPNAKTTIRQDGGYTLQVDTEGLQTGQRYTLGVVANGSDNPGNLSTDEFAQYTTGTLSIKIGAGAFSASLSRAVYAYGTRDTVTVSGTTNRKGATVHLYAVSPRGELAVGERRAAKQRTFERAFREFETRGDYRFLVVFAGADDRFEASLSDVLSRVNEGQTQTQVIEILRQTYAPPGSDDRIRELRLNVQSPSLRITSLPLDSRLEPGTVTVAGTTNREPETKVSVVVRRYGTEITEETTKVTANGQWRVKLDLSDLPDGSYTVEATAGDTGDAQTFELATKTPTPRATERPATDTATARPPPKPTTAVAESTTKPTVTGTESTGAGPGFGIVSVWVAVVLVGLFVRRHR